MLVTFVLRATCMECSLSIRGLTFRQVDILRHRLRTRRGDVGLAWIPRNCPECGSRAITNPEIHDLAPYSRTEINTWRRERRGWPRLPAMATSNERTAAA